MLAGDIEQPVFVDYPTAQDRHDETIDTCPPVDTSRPAIEWSVWGRVGIGVAFEPATEATSASELALSGELTLGFADEGNIRVGAWGEVRTSTAPVAGLELVVEGLTLPPYGDGIDGSIIVRTGANARIVTSAVGFGYVGSFHDFAPRPHHVIGARVLVTLNEAKDDPGDWSATVGLEVEPIGAVHAIVDLVSDR